MRTWSVSGTAFALCTRSSSLSIRTSTSIRRILLLRAQRRPAAPVREHAPEPLGYGFRNQLVHVSTEGGDLLHAAGGDEADLGARHHENRLDFRGERPVQVVHLKLPLEVRDHAQALDDHLRLPAAR